MQGSSTLSTSAVSVSGPFRPTVQYVCVKLGWGGCKAVGGGGGSHCIRQLCIEENTECRMQFYAFSDEKTF